MGKKEYYFAEDEKLEAIRKEEIERLSKLFKEQTSHINMDFKLPEFKTNSEDVLKGRERFFKSMSEKFGKDFVPYKE